MRISSSFFLERDVVSRVPRLRVSLGLSEYDDQDPRRLEGVGVEGVVAVAASTSIKSLEVSPCDISRRERRYCSSSSLRYTGTGSEPFRGRLVISDRRSNAKP